MTVQEMLDVAIERIRPHLPENYEIDDIAWGDNAFQICIFDVSKFPGILADRFFFLKRSGETETETAFRLNDTINEYITNWRKHS